MSKYAESEPQIYYGICKRICITIGVILPVISFSAFTNKGYVYASGQDAGADQGAGLEIDMDALGDGTAIDIDLNDLNIEIAEDKSESELEADTDTLTETTQDKDEAAGNDLQRQLEEEMREAVEDIDRQTAEQERLHKQHIWSIIWKAVIAILIIAIFAVGIISSVRNGEEARTDNDQIKSKQKSANENRKESKLSDIEIVDLDSDDSLNVR